MAETKSKAELMAEARERARPAMKTREELGDYLAGATPKPVADMLVKPGTAPAPPAIATPESPAGESAATPPPIVTLPETLPTVEKAPRPARKRAAAPVPVESFPWENLDPRLRAPFSTQFPMSVQEKLKHLTENLPKATIQNLVHKYVSEGLEAELRKIYGEDYRP